MIKNEESNTAFRNEAVGAIAVIKERLQAINSPDGYAVAIETIEQDKISYLEWRLSQCEKTVKNPQGILYNSSEKHKPGFEVLELRKMIEVVKRVEGVLRARIRLYLGQPALAKRDTAVRKMRNWQESEEVTGERAMSVNTMMALAWAVANN